MTAGRIASAGSFLRDLAACCLSPWGDAAALATRFAVKTYHPRILKHKGLWYCGVDLQRWVGGVKASSRIGEGSCPLRAYIDWAERMFP